MHQPVIVAARRTPVGAIGGGLAPLLAQDLAVVPMLIVISLFSNEQPGSDQILKQLAGAVIVLGLAAFALSREHFRLPFATRIRQDHELQVFAALLICFGLAFVTGTLGLSSGSSMPIETSS